MSDLRAAARNLLDAFGGDTPDWLREEASALETALLTTSPGEALLAELRAPFPGYDSFVEDFDYAAALHRIVEKARDVGMRPVQTAPLFVDDDKPKMAGQLPHETYQGAEDRRSRGLMDTAYNLLSEQPPCSLEVDMRNFQGRVFEAGLVAEYLEASQADDESERTANAINTLSSHWDCAPEDVARRVALHGTKL